MGAMVVGAMAATLTCGLVALDLHRSHGRLESLLQLGSASSAITVLRHDFPTVVIPPGNGDDGEVFYAMARDPLHLGQVARQMDRPRYRLQRPGYPLVAWVLHPRGGGRGLIWALAAANAIGVALGGAAVALLSQRAGRRPWWGLAAGALPGAFVTMRISCSDVLAAGLALLAVALFFDRRLLAAAVLALGAAMTKEVTLLVIGGSALAFVRTEPRRALAFVLPAASGASILWLALRIAYPNAGHTYGEFALPLHGLYDAFWYWHNTADIKPEATLLLTVTLACVAWRRHRHSALAPVIALELGLCTVLAMGPIAAWSHGPRTLYPLGLMSVAVIATAPLRTVSISRAAALSSDR